MNFDWRSWLNSNRAKALIVGLLIVLLRDNLPVDITEADLTKLVGLIIAFILGDTYRPINQSKRLNT